MSKQDLFDILGASRRNNPKIDVTGLLLYQNGQFAQVLEGPERAVRDTFERIKQDERHTNVSVTIENHTAGREFGNWEMGFADVAITEDGRVQGLSDFMVGEASTDEIFAYESKVKTFLKMFQNLTASA